MGAACSFDPNRRRRWVGSGSADELPRSAEGPPDLQSPGLASFVFETGIVMQCQTAGGSGWPVAPADWIHHHWVFVVTAAECRTAKAVVAGTADSEVENLKNAAADAHHTGLAQEWPGESAAVVEVAESPVEVDNETLLVSAWSPAPFGELE